MVFFKAIMQIVSGYRIGQKTFGQYMVSCNANKDSLRPLQDGSATATPVCRMQQYMQFGSPYLL